MTTDKFCSVHHHAPVSSRFTLIWVEAMAAFPDANDGALVLTVSKGEEPESEALCCAFSISGFYLAVGYGSGRVRVVSLARHAVTERRRLL